MRSRGLALGCIIAVAAIVLALQSTPVDAATKLPVPTTRNGSHDFNFLFGTWRTHYRLLRKRLVRSHDWYDCYGTSTITPFWGGAGNLEDGDLRCQATHRYISGMTLRLYNATTHQWSLWWGTRTLGLVPPAQVGHFTNGVGDFFANDTWEGKPVIVRFRWMLRGAHPRFEQAFSTDGGRTWETNWTTDYTKRG